MNKPFIVAGIKNLHKKNYKIDPQTFDVEAHVDSTLTFSENWGIIKKMINLPNSTHQYYTCKHCSKQVGADWEYCPKCGKPLEDKHGQ